MQSRLESGSESGFYGSQFLVLPVAREVFCNIKCKTWTSICSGFSLHGTGCHLHEAWRGHGHALFFFFFLLITLVFCVLQGTYLLYIHITYTYIARDISFSRMPLSFRSPLKDMTSTEYFI